MRRLLICVFFGALAAIPVRNDKGSHCGYKACDRAVPGSLNVHIVPHSHDDVGWLKTVDQYYYGSKPNIQKAGVQYILDSVIAALKENPERRFIQVETAFFKKWWDKQTDVKKEEVKGMVENGQLEFVGGAWSMNDEGAAHYQSIIDQFELGLTFLNETFGECGRPKIGWQIDPFGHSKEMATIFAQLGYDGLFFSRLDYRDKTRRMLTKTADMIWQGSKSLGNESNLFTSILFNHYSAPSGFCFDILCNDEPIIDDLDSPDYNYEDQVSSFAEFIQDQAENYATNNIIITMGDDFNYQDAFHNFVNLDKLIDGFKIWPRLFNELKINVFYSTPSCYVKAVNDEVLEKKQALAVKTDDFFPYANDYHAYWSGYFTSRPTSKRFERQANNLLQVAKQLSSMSPSSPPDITPLKDAVGIMQHHDAITGTEKQHVADDYHKIVDEAIANATEEVSKMISKLVSKSDYDLKLQNCLLANISVCPYTLSDDILVAVYNPLSRPANYYVKLPVDNVDYTIKDPNNATLKYQVTPRISSFRSISGNFDMAANELVFKASHIPPFGLKFYTLTKIETKEYIYVLQQDESSKKYKLGDNEFGATFDKKTKLLNAVIINNTRIHIKQELMYYVGAAGLNIGFENRASGAYIFRPSPDMPNALHFPPMTTSVTYRGALFDEFRQTYLNWAVQIIRVYKHEKYIEFDWVIGPIDVADENGKEIISRFTTSLETDDIFYTDSNGREMIERVRDYRETYNLTNKEPVARNYYPVTTKITLKDANIQISVINDRAQGGTSLKSGEMEVMMHRRLLYDDGFGVGEALNEEQFDRGLIARGTHYLTITGKGFPSLQTERQLAEEKLLSPWQFISAESKPRYEWETLIDFEFAGITKKLPNNIQILTLEPHPTFEDSTILRLQHLYEEDEDAKLSGEATVDLNDIFSKFVIVSLRETTLGANQWLEHNNRLDWILGGDLKDANYLNGNVYGGNVLKSHRRPAQKEADFKVSLYPMEIRTFVLTIKKKI